MTIILIHGFMGFPNNCYFPWLKKELESRGNKVLVPQMPRPAYPEKLTWVKTIRSLKCDPAETILVGHSLGCAALLHFLQEHRGDAFQHVVLTSGFGRPFVSMKSLERWFDPPLDFSVIKTKSEKWTAVHSKNDILVPFREGEWLASQLGADLIIENKGHLTKREGAKELPSVLEAIIGNV